MLKAPDTAGQATADVATSRPMRGLMMMSLSIGITLPRDAQAVIAAMATLFAGAACGSSTTGPSTPGTGSLTVTIAAPAGVTPAVSVTGPGGYSKALAATTTLTGLAVGTYNVVAATIGTAGAIVATVNTPTVTGAPAIVTGGGVVYASATYSPGGSGGLWIANYNSQQIVQFSASQLAGTTSAAAAVAITTGSVDNFGVAFDGSGDLWVSTYGQYMFQEYVPDQLTISNAHVPNLGLYIDGRVAGLTFDAIGDLWVANNDSSTLWAYGSNNLAYSCPICDPDLVISSALHSMSGPTGIAFDSHGNLWVANGTGNTLVEYTAAQTDTGGALTPAITLTASGNSIHGPMMIAFDASGNLWVANGNQVNYSSVVEFSAAQLAASGSPAPKVTLTSNAGTLNQPTGLAFDTTAISGSRTWATTPC